jgi:hypothetical protein
LNESFDQPFFRLYNREPAQWRVVYKQSAEALLSSLKTEGFLVNLGAA